MAKKLTAAEKIRRYVASHPTAKPRQIAAALDVKASYVSVLKATDKKRGIVRYPTAKIRMQASESANTVKPYAAIELIEPENDPVNHPAHYKVGGIETIDFIEAKKLNYNLGNAVKYITRADHKGNRREDLEKAAWYIKRELAAM